MSAWLTVIGIGDDGIENLPPASRALLDAADVVAGSERVLLNANLGAKEALIWGSPFEESLERLLDLKGRDVVVLATGDPMHYGIAATLLRHVPAKDMAILPAPSAFSLAAARLGWPLQDVEPLSLHGRPVSLLHPFVQPGARVIALTGSGGTVSDVAELLKQRGFGPSALSILEHMGGPYERIVSTTAEDCGKQDFADFNTLAIECAAGPGPRILPRIPGLPDDAFVHDGQLTKREVRAVTVATLAPTPGALLWDVGAGCGSVAIEWMRSANNAQAIAFERNEERVRMIAQNAVALGAPGLEVVPGDARDTISGNEVPDAIFLGGALAGDKVFKACWMVLPKGGRLVANAVTLEGEAALIARHEKHGGELVRMEVSHVSAVGKRRAMQPRMAVTQWRAVKE